jgi:hypothetical protein
MELRLGGFDSLPAIPLRRKYSMLPWQLLAIKFFDRCCKKFGYALLGDEMGIGKVRTPTLRFLVVETKIRLSRRWPICGSEYIKPLS